MTLQERLADVTQRIEVAKDLEIRAIDAANRAKTDAVYLEGQAALLKDLIAETST